MGAPFPGQPTFSDWLLLGGTKIWPLYFNDRHPWKGFPALELPEWLAKAPVATVSQVGFCLCLVLISLLPHSSSWEHVPLNLLQTHLSILESLSSGAQRRYGDFYLPIPLVVHLFWRKGNKVPQVKLPRLLQVYGANNSSQTKNQMTILVVSSGWFFLLLSKISRLLQAFLYFLFT